MNRRFFLCFFCVFILINRSDFFAQNTTISGYVKTKSIFGKQIYLNETIGLNNFLIDSIKIDDQGKFEYPLKIYQKGYYQLFINDTSKIDFIINPVESMIQFTFDSLRLQDGITINKSIENTALWDYKKYSRSINEEIRQYEKTSGFIAKKDSLLKQAFQQNIDRLVQSKQLYLSELISKYPNTFFGKSTIAMEEKTFSSIAETKSHYFDSVDFSDPSLIRSAAFPKKIMSYLQKYTEYSEEGFILSISLIMNKAAANSEVQEFTLNFLLDIFDRVGPQLIFHHLVENYVLKDGCGDEKIEKSLSGKIEEYRKLLPGNIAPEITLNDSLGKTIVLSEYVKQNKLTLLFFWSSYCHYCHQALPDLKWIYSKYKDKNIGVYAVSLDEQKSEWTKAVKDKELHWINVSDLKGWDSPVAKQYKVHKTPSFYFLDNEMRIISKPTDIQYITIFFSGFTD